MKLAHQTDASVASLLRLVQEQNDWAKVENLLFTSWEQEKYAKAQNEARRKYARRSETRQRLDYFTIASYITVLPEQDHGHTAFFSFSCSFVMFKLKVFNAGLLYLYEIKQCMSQRLQSLKCFRPQGTSNCSCSSV